MSTDTYFGNSMNGMYAGPSATESRWPDMLSYARGNTEANGNYLDGAMAGDQADQVYALPSGNTYFVMLGTNDARISGGDSGKRANFKATLAALIARLACTISTAKSGWTFSGTWTDTWAFGPASAAQLGRYSDSSGATATFTSTGDVLMMGFIAQQQSGVGGGFTVTRDGGTSVGSFSTVGFSGVTTNLGRTYVPQLLRWTGLGAGSHTITATAQGYRSYVDYVVTGSSGNRVVVTNIPRFTAAGYANSGGSDAIFADFNSDIADAVSWFTGIGCDVRLADVASQIDPSIHTASDGVHLNLAGKKIIASVNQAASV